MKRKESMMNKRIRLDQKTIQLLLIVLFLFAGMAFLQPEKFLRPTNIHSMLVQLPEQGLYALCIAICYLSKGIDLSIVSTANLVGIVNGIMFRTLITPQTTPGEVTGLVLLSLAIALVIGGLCGLLNGFLVAQLGIFPILVTLGTQSIYAGIGMALTQGRAEMNFPEALLNIGNANLFPIGTFEGIPLITIIFLIIFAVMCVVVHKTPYGLKLQWYGSNGKVSFFTGIDNKRVVMTTFIISGLIASLAGMISVARVSSAMADYGGTFVFQALLICVLSGISPLGGKGKIYNIIFSLLAMQILNTGFNMMRISPLIRDSLYGVLLVASLIIELVQRKHQAKRLNRNAVHL